MLDVDNRGTVGAGILFLLLGHFVLWRVIQDVGVQFVARVHIGHVATRFALEMQPFLADLDVGLRVPAGVALDKALDEAFQKLRQLAGIMSTIHNRGAGTLLVLRLCPELTAKVLDDVCDDRCSGNRPESVKAAATAYSQEGAPALSQSLRC